MTQVIGRHNYVRGQQLPRRMGPQHLQAGLRTLRGLPQLIVASHQGMHLRGLVNGAVYSLAAAAVTNAEEFGDDAHIVWPVCNAVDFQLATLVGTWSDWGSRRTAGYSGW